MSNINIFLIIYFGPPNRVLKFSTCMLSLFIIKICFTIKVNTISGGAQLLVSGCLESMCLKSNSQGFGLRILELVIAGPKPEGFDSRVPGLRSQGLGSQVPGSWVSGSRVLILDYALQ